jgi:hypothetical protein
MTLAESHDEEQIIARIAALEIGKTEVVCCVRIPADANSKKRLQEVSTHSTMTRSLTEVANHLVGLGVERVVMEATSDYWKPVFYLIEAHGLDPAPHRPPVSFSPHLSTVAVRTVRRRNLTRLAMPGPSVQDSVEVLRQPTPRARRDDF